MRWGESKSQQSPWSQKNRVPSGNFSRIVPHIESDSMVPHSRGTMSPVLCMGVPKRSTHARPRPFPSTWQVADALRPDRSVRELKQAADPPHSEPKEGSVAICVNKLGLMENRR